MDDESFLAHSHLLEQAQTANIELFNLIKFNGRVELKINNHSLIEYLSKTIVGQQLSGKAATTIWQRIISQKPTEQDFTDFIINTDNVELLNCGISRNKLKSIKLLCGSKHKLENLHQALENRDPLKIKESITAFWGLGEWTADMFLIFFCNFPDIMPSNDGTILKGLENLGLSESTQFELLTKASL